MMGNRERLIYMANQIARNFAVHGEAEAIAETANHIALFWDPRMRETILGCSVADGLEPVALAAVDRLRATAA